MGKDKKQIVFMKNLKFLSNWSNKDLQRFLRLHYFDFCVYMGMKNTVGTYREYRSLCRGIYGVDLTTTRPKKAVSPVEMQMDLFSSFLTE